MFKLGYHKNNKLEKYNYSDIYSIEQNSSYERIIIGLAEGHINTVLEFDSSAFRTVLYVIRSTYSSD